MIWEQVYLLSQMTEVTEEPCLFVFAGNRDVLASPGSYFFLSNSAGQGDEWLKSLNKGVWIPFTGIQGCSFY